jgi:hypothetical protein
MMNSKPSDLLLAFQDEFVNLCLDDARPAAMLAGYVFDNKESERKIIIEFIYECMRLKLIEVTHQQASIFPSTPDAMKAYLHKESGDKHPLLRYHHWDMFFFVGTQKLKNLLEKHGLRNWEAMDAPLNMAFINEVFAGE